MPPSLRITLWQGIIGGRGFFAIAFATARTALGCPDIAATCRYVRVSPYGILTKAHHTSRWNGVPGNSKISLAVKVFILKYDIKKFMFWKMFLCLDFKCMFFLS